MGFTIAELVVQIEAHSAGFNAAILDAKKGCDGAAVAMDGVTTASKGVGRSLADLQKDISAGVASYNATAVAAKQVSAEVTSTAAAVDTMARSAKGSRLAAMELGRGLEDVLVTGSPLGAINNINHAIEQMAMQAGLSAGAMFGLSAAVTVAGLALTAVVKHWDDLMEMMGAGIPQPAIGGLEGMEAALRKVEKELGALREKARLTYPELLRIHELEAKRAEMREKVAVEKSVEELVGKPSEETEERGKDFTKAVAETGGPSAFLALQEALTRQVDETGKVASAATGKAGTPEEITKALFAGAKEGSQAARDEIIAALRAAFGSRGSELERNMTKFSPEQRKKARDAEEALKREKDAAKADDDLGRKLNAQGKENQRMSERQAKRSNRLSLGADKELTRQLNEQGRQNERISDQQRHKNRQERDRGDERRMSVYESLEGKGDRFAEQIGRIAGEANKVTFAKGVEGAQQATAYGRQRLEARGLGDLARNTDQRASHSDLAGYARKLQEGAFGDVNKQQLRELQRLVAGVDKLARQGRRPDVPGVN